MGARIGILRTDRVMDEFRSRYGDYPEMFEGLLRGADEDVVIESFWAQNPAEIPDPVTCDAYVITGSRHSVYDELPWIPPLVDFLERALEVEKKVVGVCFGHQLMAHFFGGEVAPAEQGWAVGVHESRVLSHQPWMGETPAERFALLSSHQDQVQALPANAEVYATNEFCPIAGFTVDDRVLTVQGHPEFEKGFAQDLMAMRREALGEEVFGRGIASLEQETHEPLLGEWIMRFVKGGA